MNDRALWLASASCGLSHIGAPGRITSAQFSSLIGHFSTLALAGCPASERKWQKDDRQKLRNDFLYGILTAVEQYVLPYVFIDSITWESGFSSILIGIQCTGILKSTEAGML